MTNGSERMPEKKDVLEFPLEEVSVPQAIVLMMQAASKSGTAWCDEQENAGWEVNTERLLALAEKLEARIEDEIEKASDTSSAPVEETEEKFADALASDVVLVMDENLETEVAMVVHKGIVYGKFCNEPVYSDVYNDIRTFCKKMWGHKNPVHEDEFGNEGA